MRQFFAGAAVVALAVGCSSAAYAQETTSSIRGTVTANGEPIANATVTIVNVPTGTKTVTVTNESGAYTAPSLRPGGPYTVSVSAAGFADFQVTDISTNIGQAFELPLALQSQGNEIVVTASKVKGAHSVSEGPAMVLNADQISRIASVNRDIRDLMERDPFATLDTTSSGGRQVSFAGVNPRFNRFTIDGVPITDSFGLNPDALPSRRGPVPLDSIGQFETKVAPYDIREGFFQGGVVNAILKSGTNQFHGTAFFTYSSDALQGDRTKPYIGVSNPDGRITVPKYNSKDYGATVSGPLLRDRVFFMVSAERVRASVPVPYGTIENNAGSPVVGLSQATFDSISATAQSKYGVNAGGILQNNGDKDDRIVGRIDANVSETQHLALTGIYTKDSILTSGTSGNSILASYSDDYTKPNRVLAGVAQLNSDWSSNISTEARVNYKDYQSGQTPLLANTAQATICAENATSGVTAGNSPTSCSTNVPSVVIGPQTSAQANILHVKTFEASLVTRATFGDHRFRFLLDGQNSKNYDLFVNGAKGSYYFDSLQAFQQGIAQTYSYTNATSGNPTDAAASFSYQTYTVGLQDDWKVNRTLNVSYGVRYDLYGGDSRPLANVNFINREGFPNNYYINGKGLVQPRVGFDWTPTQRLSIRGGGGLFGGGTPDVYIANSFSASGVQPATATAAINAAGTQYNINGVTSAGNAASGQALLNNVSLTTIPSLAQTLVKGSANTSTSAIAQGFKIPSQWRATLSASYKADLGRFGDGWNFGADLLYSKVKDAILYKDDRDRPLTGASSQTPDGRQRYYDVVCGPGGGTVCSDTGGDYVLGDTSKGRTWVATVHFDKTWNFGLNLSGAFTYQDARDQQALTSSVASSNYNNGAYDDANGGAYGHTNDEVRYAFKYDLGYSHAFYRDYKTRFDLFGQTRIGSPYSYTFYDPTCCSSTRSNVFGTVGTSSHYLFYVPTANDPLVTYDSAATQAAVQNLINTTGLKNYRGQIAPRNAFNSKWFTKLDLHVEQEVPTFVGSSRFTIFADVENFLNLLNHNWGETYRAAFPYDKQVVNVTCVAQGSNSCGKYLYSKPSSAATLADQFINYTPGTSLFTVRVGARFTF